MILLIDNYDSFSYNLVQLIGGILKEQDSSEKIKVVRNDELSVSDVRNLNPSHIIISPGPGRPENAGICEDVIKEMGSTVPILGICLGHQAICETYGANIVYAKQLMHGKKSEIHIEADPIFSGVSDNTVVARYHSLAADINTIPKELLIIANTKDGEIMAVKHSIYNTYGLQFHPESVLTKEGKTMLINFLNVH